MNNNISEQPYFQEMSTEGEKFLKVVDSNNQDISTPIEIHSGISARIRSLFGQAIKATVTIDGEEKKVYLNKDDYKNWARGGNSTFTLRLNDDKTLTIESKAGQHAFVYGKGRIKLFEEDRGIKVHKHGGKLLSLFGKAEKMRIDVNEGGRVETKAVYLNKKSYAKWCEHECLNHFTLEVTQEKNPRLTVKEPPTQPPYQEQVIIQQQDLPQEENPEDVIDLEDFSQDIENDQIEVQDNSQEDSNNEGSVKSKSEIAEQIVPEQELAKQPGVKLEEVAQEENIIEIKEEPSLSHMEAESEPIAKDEIPSFIEPNKINRSSEPEEDAEVAISREELEAEQPADTALYEGEIDISFSESAFEALESETEEIHATDPWQPAESAPNEVPEEIQAEAELSVEEAAIRERMARHFDNVKNELVQTEKTFFEATERNISHIEVLIDYSKDGDTKDYLQHVTLPSLRKILDNSPHNTLQGKANASWEEIQDAMDLAGEKFKTYSEGIEQLSKDYTLLLAISEAADLPPTEDRAQFARDFITPMQRFTKLPLLFKELMSSSEPEGKEALETHEALILERAKQLNESVRQAENAPLYNRKMRAAAQSKIETRRLVAGDGALSPEMFSTTIFRESTIAGHINELLLKKEVFLNLAPEALDLLSNSLTVLNETLERRKEFLVQMDKKIKEHQNYKPPKEIEEGRREKILARRDQVITNLETLKERLMSDWRLRQRE